MTRAHHFRPRSSSRSFFAAGALALGLGAFLTAAETPRSGLETGTAAARSKLVCVTTGSGESLTADVETVDPKEGGSTRVGTLVLAKGQKRVQSQDLAWSADGKQLLVAQLEFADAPAESSAWLDWVDPATLKVARSGPRTVGVLDALCWDGQGRLLAVMGRARPLQLVRLDAATGEAAEIGKLDTRFWLRSLVWRTQPGELWGLHMRASEDDTDALVRLSAADGSVTKIVRLDLGEHATTLCIDAEGAFLVAGSKQGLYRVDPDTGKSKRLPKELGHLVTGLVTGR